MSETDKACRCYINMKIPGVFLSPCWDVSPSKDYQPALLSLVLREDRSNGINPPMGLIPEIIPIKLFLGLVPGYFADVTHVMREEPKRPDTLGFAHVLFTKRSLGKTSNAPGMPFYLNKKTCDPSVPLA